MISISCQAFSQRDTSRIEISTENARRAFKELIEKDYLEKQVLSLELQINTQNELIQNKEIETDNLNGQIEAYESLSKSKDERLSNNEQIVENLEKELSRKKASNTFWKICVGALSGLATYLAIK